MSKRRNATHRRRQGTENTVDKIKSGAAWINVEWREGLWQGGVPVSIGGKCLCWYSLFIPLIFCVGNRFTDPTEAPSLLQVHSASSDQEELHHCFLLSCLHHAPPPPAQQDYAWCCVQCWWGRCRLSRLVTPRGQQSWTYIQAHEIS